MPQFVLKDKLAAETFAVTNQLFVKYYLMQAILMRARQAEAARAKSAKSASGRYIPFKGAVEFSFIMATGGVFVKKRSRYMTGRLDALVPVEQIREVLFTPDSWGVQYTFFTDLKDEAGCEISQSLSTKQVATFAHEKDSNKINVVLLNEVAADMFSFLYSQRPEEKALKALKLQKVA